MIIFFEHGRLGNQLFQYAALKKYAGKEKICLIGFDDLRDTFDGLDAVFPLRNYSLLYKILQRFGRRFFNCVLPATRLFTTLEQEVLEDGISIRVKKGLINKIKYCVTGYFQSEKVFSDSFISNLHIKLTAKISAGNILKAIPQKCSHIFFVHVRRTDYLKWPTQEYPAVLPADWYIRCIDKILAKYPQAYFVFCSDDVHYVQDVFGYLPNSYISSGDLAQDFAIMTMCHGGILSASSFAWWATYFAKSKNPDGLFLAPLYWAGHRNGQWYPPHIKASFMEYVDVYEDITQGSIPVVL
ncbi:alpha-1,2-fucosyltransferase [Desulfonatronum thioautotrophicum]|uniref:alpha-1,2-fucosyltransferase n=1 Tax=Desulfonatronum thioautotrophicum TaxID=617001 RepID=UPI000A866DA6|nr:alpha-1,2-fucosyltransferase [Desulfonatronum thioautotrophicum]